jgi:hypothetical protein
MTSGSQAMPSSDSHEPRACRRKYQKVAEGSPSLVALPPPELRVVMV